MIAENYFEVLGLRSPYTRFKLRTDLVENLQGWNGKSPIFSELITEIRPSVIIEVGSYLGLSAVTMAKSIQDLQLESHLFCVDTWLGSPEHWKGPMLKEFHYFTSGTSILYDQFIVNMIINKVDDIVIPIPNTSKNAYYILNDKGIKADLVYVDGSHHEDDVCDDIMLYSNMLTEKGVIFGDDWSWNSVKRGLVKAVAKLEMKIEVKHVEIEVKHDKFWVLRKVLN